MLPRVPVGRSVIFHLLRYISTSSTACDVYAWPFRPTLVVCYFVLDQRGWVYDDVRWNEKKKSPRACMFTFCY